MKLSAIVQEARYVQKTEGVSEAARQFDDLARAQQGAAQSAELVARQHVVEEQAITRLGSKLEGFTRKHDPITKALREVERGESLVAAARSRGLEVTQAHIGALDMARERYAHLTRGLNDNAKSVGLARHEWINLSRQFQDVGVSLAGGQSPMTVLLQQGSQVADVFSSSGAGAGAALRTFGGTVLRFALNPVTLFAAGVGAAVFAQMRWKDQTDALTISLNGLGRQSGLTVTQLNRLAETNAGTAGISQSAARGLAGQFAGAGVPGESIGGAIGVTGAFSRGLGLDLEKAGEQLAAALADPARGADELARRYGIVSFAEREHIKELAAVGDRSAASAKLLEILSARIADMEDPTSRLAKLWETIKGGFSKGLDDFGKIIDKTIEGKDAIANRERERARRALDGALRAQADRDAERKQELSRLAEDSAFAIREIQARTFAEREAVASERARTQTLRETHDAVKASIAAESERAKLFAESARKAEDMLRSASDQNELARLSPYERAMREIDFKYRDAREQLLPNAATPMAAEFSTAGNAAEKLGFVLNRVAENVAGKFGGLIPLSQWRGGGAGLPLLARGGLHESIMRAEGTNRFGDPYNTSLGYMRSPKPLTQMTMAESLAWGDKVRVAQGLNSSAKGAFQITNTTQRDAMGALGFSPKDMFSVENQNRMADWIFSTQGLNAWEGFKKGGPAANDNFGIGRIGGDLAGAEAQERAQRQFELLQKPLKEANAEIERQRALLNAQAAAFGRSTEEVARAAKQQELLNQFQQAGVPLSEQLRVSIAETADNYGRLARETEEAAERQRRLVYAMDEVRSIARETLGSLISDLAHGKKASEALGDALGRIGDRLLSSGVDTLVDSLFGRSGKAGGGLFGNLLSGLFSAFEDGGFVGAPSGRAIHAPISAFVGAPHFNSGGVVGGARPIFAHDGELIMNLAMQRNAANNYRAALGSGNDNRRNLSPGVINFNLPPGTDVQSFMKSEGQISAMLARAAAGGNRYT